MPLDGITERFRSVLATILTVLDLAEQFAEDRVDRKFDFDTSTRLGRAAQEGTVMTVVTVGIIIVLGILVYAEIESALPAPSNNDLSDASNNATGTFGDAMELAPVILIVLIAAVVLAVVQRFR